MNWNTHRKRSIPLPASWSIILGSRTEGYVQDYAFITPLGLEHFVCKNFAWSISLPCLLCFGKRKIIPMVAIKQQRCGAAPGEKQHRIHSLHHRRGHRRDFLQGSFQLSPKYSKVWGSVLLERLLQEKPFYKYRAGNEPRWELWGLDPISSLSADSGSRSWKGGNKWMGKDVQRWSDGMKIPEKIRIRESWNQQLSAASCSTFFS